VDTWDYKGKKQYYATCSNCFRKVSIAKQHQYVVAREGLVNLVESLRKLSKELRVSLLILSYAIESWSSGLTGSVRKTGYT